MTLRKEIEFDFKSEIIETQWLVSSLFPLGQLCFILAQAGVGKSLIVENLAVCIVHGIPFAGLKTVEGDVLLVDQDSPQNILTKRLIQFGKGLNTQRKYKLFVESMKGYTLGDNTLIAIIQDYPSVKLIIIDSLHSVCGRFNPNLTTDMNYWSIVKEHCLTSGKTILVNHHISQKLELSVDNLMSGMPNALAMGNSAIIQQADSYYVVGATAENGRTERIYIRPVSKRVSIPQKPLVLRCILPESGGEAIVFDNYYEPELEEAEQDLIILFREHPTVEMTVKEVYEASGHRHGEKAVRDALKALDQKGMLLMSKQKANLFKYRLP